MFFIHFFKGLLVCSMMILKFSADTKLCEQKLDEKISEEFNMGRTTSTEEFLMTSFEDDVVTNYLYYEFQKNKENIGLQYDVSPKHFFLNGKEFRILSGSIHYFRVRPEYWRDRLKKLRAMGANTVET